MPKEIIIMDTDISRLERRLNEFHNEYNILEAYSPAAKEGYSPRFFVTIIYEDKESD